MICKSIAVVLTTCFYLIGSFKLRGNDIGTSKLAKKNGLHTFRGSKESSIEGYEYIRLNPGADFHPFYFGLGNSGFFSRQTFLLEVPLGGVQVIVTDCYCSGDSFRVFANGNFLMDVQGGQMSSSCKFYEREPLTCSFSDKFSKNSVVMAPGTFNITIMIKESPFGGGAGFILVK
jgi:hypothetical protein